MSWTPWMENFEAYFSRADLDQDGRISGQEADDFFKGASLPTSVLAEVWTIVHRNKTGFLDRDQFLNALRLVSVAQNGRQLTPDIVQMALYGPATPLIPAPIITTGTSPPQKGAGAGVAGGPRPQGNSAMAPVPGQAEATQVNPVAAPETQVPRDIPLQLLKEITNNFCDAQIVGQGAFGVVYKGLLKNGETIAVKKIVSSLMPGLQKQFESEVYHLMMLTHPNIVRCVGYCYETRNVCLEHNGRYVFAEMAERLLCLEYLPKGSLDKYLSDESSGLDWSTRYKIIEGICYGLCHLHGQLGKPIIHLDLKPANILLDDGMLPKITDFGLSRLLDQEQTICTSSRDGTFGYMAPEFLHGGEITPKSDIFSLGVIIMEVITGHRDYPDITGTPLDDFIDLTLKKWQDALKKSPGYGSFEAYYEQIRRCIQVGLICVNPDCTKRPSIANVINMLQEEESTICNISNEAEPESSRQV